MLKFIESSNKSIWEGKNYKKLAKKGLYEVYFIIFHNAKRHESYWIRYTLVCNKQKKNRNDKVGQGLLWFGYFNSQEPNKNFMVKKHFPLEKVKGTFIENGVIKFITIDNAFLSLLKATGKFMTKSGKEFLWELSFSKFQKPYYAVPKLARTLKITNTINNATHPHFEVSGKVVMNGVEIQIEKADGIQYHTYADSYKHPWEWFSVYTIKEWPLGFIDFSYKVNKGILEINNGETSLTSWNKNFLMKLLKSKKLKRKKTIDSIIFNMVTKQLSIEGIVDVSKNDLIGVEYLGPTGEKFYCYNSEIASVKLKIIRQGKKKNENIINEIVVNRSIAFETTDKEPIEGIKYLNWNDEELFTNY